MAALASAVEEKETRLATKFLFLKSLSPDIGQLCIFAPFEILSAIFFSQ